MKKRFSALFLCFALVFSLTGCGLKDVIESSNENDTTSYNKESLADLTYMVPSSWERADADEGYYYYPEEGGLFYAYVDEVDLSTGNSKYFKEVYDGFISAFDNTELLNETTTEIIDVPAKLYSLNFTLDDVTYSAQVLVFIYNYYVYGFIISFPNSLPDDYTQYFAKITDSIKTTVPLNNSNKNNTVPPIDTDENTPQINENNSDDTSSANPSSSHASGENNENGNTTIPPPSENPSSEAAPSTTPPASEQPSPPSSPEQSSSPPTSSTSTEQQNALDKAYSYLKFMSFSRQGLIGQLEYEGFSTEAATWAADNCGANWNEQALNKSQSYLQYMAFSYQGLINQLEYDGFTYSQAQYGADNCGADWYTQAADKAASYLDFMSFSRDGLIDQLLYDGFTYDQAVYGAEANGL